VGDRAQEEEVKREIKLGQIGGVPIYADLWHLLTGAVVVGLGLLAMWCLPANAGLGARFAVRTITIAAICFAARDK